MSAWRILCLLFFGLLAIGQPSGSISGKVVHGVSGEAIAGAAVELDLHKTQSDEAGAFRLERLGPGVHHVKVMKDGYALVNRDLLFQLGAGEQVTGIVLRMIPEASISGRLLTSRKEPVEGIVTVVAPGQFGTIGLAGTKSGYFKIDRLPPGRYQIFANGISSGPGSSRKVWFPDKTTDKEAETVSLSVGVPLTGIEIVFNDIQRFPITGRFTGPLPGSQVTTVLCEFPSGSLAGSTRLDPNGRFAVDLPEGSYTLKVLSFPGRPAPPVVLGYTGVTVAGAPLNAIEIPPSPLHTVKANFVWVGPPASIPDPRFGLNPMERLGVWVTGKRDANGLIAVERVPPDRYSVLPGGFPDHVYVQSISAGGADISQRGLDLITGSATDIEIRLASDGASVEGILRDGSAKPVSGARISVFRSSPHRTEQELWSRQAVTGANGHFSQSGLAPGEYTVTVFADGKATAKQTIRLTSGQRLVLQLSLP